MMIMLSLNIISLNLMKSRVMDMYNLLRKYKINFTS